MGQYVLNMALYDGILNKKQTYGMANAYVFNADEKIYNPKATKALPANDENMTLMTMQYHLFGDPAVKITVGGQY